MIARKIILSTITIMLLVSVLGIQATTIKNYEYDNTFVPGQVIVGFNQNYDIEKYQVGDFDPILKKEILKKNEALNFIVVKVNKGSEDFYINKYQKNSNVDYAEKDYLFFSEEITPNDSGWDRQWGPENIKCPEAWQTNQGSKSVVIAIVDTGVDYDHPDLAANMWTNSQGHHGYDFIENDNTPMDEKGHGTHCAGIAAAVMNNNYGIAGVAQVSIMAVRVLGRDGSSSGSSLADGITYAADNGADVISMSIGCYSSSTTTRNACQHAWEEGALLVASAGNDNNDWDHYPSDYDNVISVAATDSDSKKAWFSNYGKNVDVAAPGLEIYSTYLGDTFEYLSGTSMACPHVSGVAALAKSRNPGWSNQQIRDKLFDSADPIGNEGTYWKYGKIDATLEGSSGPVKPSVFVKIDTITNSGSGLDGIDVDGKPEWFYEVTIDHQTTETVKNFYFNSNPEKVETDLLSYYIEEYQSESGSTSTWNVNHNHVFDSAEPQVTLKIKLMEDDFIFDWFSDIADISSRNNPGGDYEIGYDERGRVFTAVYDLVNDEIVTSQSDRVEVESGYYVTRGDWDGSTNGELLDWKQDDAKISFKITDDYEPPEADAHGPYTGKIGEKITLSASATKGLPQYTFSWDIDNDGDFEYEGESTQHSWSTEGTYTIVLKVTDSFQQTDTVETTVTISENAAPNKPTINGPTKGEAGKTYTYTIYASDSNGDKVQYYVEWGDGSNSGWTYLVSSGDSVSLDHSWDNQNNYEIKAKTKDALGKESDWTTLRVTMPKVNEKTSLENKITNLEKISLILQKILELLNPIFNKILT